MKKNVVIALFIIAALSLAYYQVGSHQFTHFDDPDYVSENAHVKTGITLENVKWAFGMPEKQYWAPVSYISHMLDVEFYGMNPGMHHLMNLLFHILNFLLLFLVLRLMTGSTWRSAFVAGLFALHPVNVDTVAWIAERKNLLSTTFWLLSMICYYYYAKKPGARSYAALLVIFAIGLMAKQMLVTLPFVFLLLDYWPLDRIRLSWNEKVNERGNRLELGGVPILRLIIEKLPMIMLSLAAIIIASRSIGHRGDILSTQLVPMGLRFENAIASYVLYIWKMIWPHALTFYYPYPVAIPVWQVIGSAALLALATLGALKCLFRAPYVLVGWLWFLGTLVPVSGIMQGGLWPAYAERWAYVPYIGLFIIISWGLRDIAVKLGREKGMDPFSCRGSAGPPCHPHMEADCILEGRFHPVLPRRAG